MQLKKLPIGIQTFSKIREDDYVYVDKTDIAYRLIKDYQYVFLSRPRRFGKSLFLDTLKNIFEGNKELFKGLAIEDKWDWEVKYPVITLILSDQFLILNDLKKDVASQINNIARDHKVELDEKEPCFMLSTLLRELHKKYSKRVVLLIDDADKPFREKLFDDDLKDIHYFLLGLYITTKDADEHIKFSMMTGIYPIKGDYLFGFNNFTDISLDSRYGNICGFTQKELKENLLNNSTFKIDHSKLKKWYNGYNFLGSDMYNPFDILLFIDNDFQYSNYWFSTGTPTFLLKLIEKNNYYLPNLSNIKVDEKILDSFDIENLDLEVILYQSGYLTIGKVTNQARGGLLYHLKVPNKEVAQSLSDHIIDFITSTDTTKRLDIQNTIYFDTKKRNVSKFEWEKY